MVEDLPAPTAASADIKAAAKTGTIGEPHLIAEGWGANWPDTITLGEAAELIDFDSYQGDDLDLVLVKQEVAAADYYEVTLEGLVWNDSEDRAGRLWEGLGKCPESVPPIVVLDGGGERVAFEGIRDGHHRVAIAHEFGRPSVPAYVPMHTTAPTVGLG